MENNLKHKDEFKKLLTKYTVSAESKQILNSTKIALMVGPSSCGRNTVIRQLVADTGYRFLVSDTTRAKRTNDGIEEQDGVEYWFRTEEGVLRDVREGKLVAPAIIHEQQVSGISIREIELAREQNATAITDIEIVGIDDIIALKPDAFAIFVLPPSFGEWQLRLQGRGHMTPSEKRRRMESAVEEFEHALEADYYHFVINDNLEHAVAQVKAITAGKRDDTVEAEGRALAASLLNDTKQLLAEV